jgi:hypothetical protein
LCGHLKLTCWYSLTSPQNGGNSPHYSCAFLRKHRVQPNFICTGRAYLPRYFYYLKIIVRLICLKWTSLWTNENNPAFNLSWRVYSQRVAWNLLLCLVCEIEFYWEYLSFIRHVVSLGFCWFLPFLNHQNSPWPLTL